MFGQRRIDAKTLSRLCRRVSISLAAGIDVRRIWQTESQRGRLAHRAKIAQMSRDIDNGESLAEAFQGTERYFPEIVLDFVRVGEGTGKLAEIFSRLADHYDHLLRLQRRFLLGILWPAIQLVGAVLIVGFLIWISGWISRTAGQPIDFLGLGLVGTRGLLIYLVMVAAVTGAGFALVQGAQRGWLSVAPMVRLVMRLPVLGPCLQSMAMSRMSWALSMAVQAGLNARQSVRVAIQCTQNVVYTDQLDAVDRQIAAGQEIHEALRAADVFPVDFVDAVEVGETSGSLDDTMERLSKQYEEQGQASSRILTMILAFATWGFVASILVALILRLAIAYRDMLFDAIG